MKSGDFPGLQNQWLGDPERWVRFPSASAIPLYRSRQRHQQFAAVPVTLCAPRFVI